MFMKEISKIYVSGALTHSGAKQRAIYEKIAKDCKYFCENIYVPHMGGTDPAKDLDVTPYDVWVKDHREVAAADLVIAYVGAPSLGVGAELEIARVTASKIILWWFKGEKISRMALGNPAVIGQIEANDEADLYEKLKRMLAVNG